MLAYVSLSGGAIGVATGLLEHQKLEERTQDVIENKGPGKMGGVSPRVARGSPRMFCATRKLVTLIPDETSAFKPQILRFSKNDIPLASA